jgi:glycosyltransferase involved in cell wall biosynthesis
MQPHMSRIVHVTSGHGPDDPRIFYSECRSLARAGYEVIQLAPQSGDSCLDGVRTIGVGPTRGRLHRMTAMNVAISREAVRQKGDIYHIHDPELLPLALLLRLLGRRVIYDIHEDVPKTVLYKHYIPAALRPRFMTVVESLENMAARRMTGLIAATPTIRERFRPLNRYTETVSNFPDANDLTPVEKRTWSERRLSVVYIGGISEERGIRELLAAVPKIQKIGAKLELAGWFWNSASMAELTNTPEWKQVRWHGMLDRSGIGELLGQVRVGLSVLHPEQNFLTALPVKMFEYMAAGIPVIASDFPLWRDIIRAADCGILVDPHDPTAIADAINHLLTHDAEAEAMGQRGRHAVEEQFNWDREECKLLAFYRSITDGRGPED